MRLFAAAAVAPLILAAAAATGPADVRQRVASSQQPRYSDSPARACASLRVLADDTLQRPKRSRRLFVEAYFMRSLVAAYEAFEDTVAAAGATPNSRRYLDRAIEFADSLVVLQNKFGYWPLGYPAVWFADMGAAAALFPAVEPYVDEARLQSYQAAVERFLTSLNRDKMLHEDGSVGVGRELIIDPTRPPRRLSREPYLVSSALVGIEVRAWLYRRTRRPELREQALRSLDYTLAQISPDGFHERVGRKEGSIRIAAYVEEGWMAADLMLDEPAVRARLKRALPAHVRWLLRSQRPDGTWDAPEDGSFARTPPIVSFLMWYDERCESRRDVRAAVRRASAALANLELRQGAGKADPDDHVEVRRALTGRPLAALARDRFVF